MVTITSVLIMAAVVTILWWIETKGGDNDGDQENKRYGV